MPGGCSSPAKGRARRRPDEGAVVLLDQSSDARTDGRSRGKQVKREGAQGGERSNWNTHARSGQTLFPVNILLNQMGSN